MRKPETTFIASVHRLLPTGLHAEKMNNPYRSGTADVWYSGNKADMWVEYKFLPALPVKKDEIIANLSPLQIKWLRERHCEGRKIHVIVGCPIGGVVLSNLDWEQPVPLSEFKKRTLTRPALANWLVEETMGKSHEQAALGHLRHPGRVAQSNHGASDLQRPLRKRGRAPLCKESKPGV